MQRAWYHGSSYRLTTLRPGSTITQEERLARIFSHKPTIVSVSDDGSIQHNGTQPGFLYIIAETVYPEDIAPVPGSTMEPGWEWLTRRELRLSLVSATEIFAEEILTLKKIETLKREIESKREQTNIT